jgi:hypothetical protein
MEEVWLVGALHCGCRRGLRLTLADAGARHWLVRGLPPHVVVRLAPAA